MAIRSEPNSLNSIAELRGCPQPRQANFLSFIKSVLTFAAADAPGIAQEHFDVITSFFSGYMFGAGTTAHRNA